MKYMGAIMYAPNYMQLARTLTGVVRESEQEAMADAEALWEKQGKRSCEWFPGYAYVENVQEPEPGGT